MSQCVLSRGCSCTETLADFGIKSVVSSVLILSWSPLTWIDLTGYFLGFVQLFLRPDSVGAAAAP